MSILTVDLASKMSAYMLTSSRGGVVLQGDSLGKSAQTLVNALREIVVMHRPQIVLLEDLPYGISRQAMTKPVTRLQGAIIISLPETTTLWINPDTWQKEYPGVGRGGGKPPERAQAAANYALERGYEAPDLVGDYVATLPEGSKVLKKHTDPLNKVRTDYVDAFLMSDYAWHHYTALQSVRDFRSTMPGVQPGNI